MNDILKKLSTFANKKYLIIIFCIGIVLMLISNITVPKKNESIKKEEYTSSGFDADKIEKQLQEILSSIEGAGKVEVMIVFESNYEKMLAKDTKSSVKNDSESSQNREIDSKTVMIKEGSSQTPYVIKEINPSVRGVLVVAEGAGKSSVKMDIKNAVKTVLNIPMHKVEVMTKKQGG